MTEIRVPNHVTAGLPQLVTGPELEAVRAAVESAYRRGYRDGRAHRLDDERTTRELARASEYYEREGAAQRVAVNHCPTCGSPDPAMSPSTWGNGAVTTLCPDRFHQGATPARDVDDDTGILEG